MFDQVPVKRANAAAIAVESEHLARLEGEENVGAPGRHEQHALHRYVMGERIRVVARDGDAVAPHDLEGLYVAVGVGETQIFYAVGGCIENAKQLGPACRHGDGRRRVDSVEGNERRRSAAASMQIHGLYAHPVRKREGPWRRIERIVASHGQRLQRRLVRRRGRALRSRGFRAAP